MGACNDGQQANKDLDALLAQTSAMVNQLKEHHDVLQLQSERIQKLATAVVILREAVKRGGEVQDTVSQVSSSVQSLLVQDTIKKHELTTITETLKELSAKIASLEELKSCDREEHDKILENRHQLDLLHKELESVQDDCEQVKTDRDRQFQELSETIKELKREVDDTHHLMRALSKIKNAFTWLLGILGTAIATYMSFKQFYSVDLPK